MDGFVVKFGNLLILIFLVLVLISYAVAYSINYKTLNSVEEVEQYCYVEDKHTEHYLIGKVPITTHYIDVHVSDAEELKYSITVSGDFYDEVEIGSEIKCILYYTDEKLVKIEIAE